MKYLKKVFKTTKQDGIRHKDTRGELEIEISMEKRMFEWWEHLQKNEQRQVREECLEAKNERDIDSKIKGNIT